MGELYRQFIERDDLNIHKWHDYFPVYERYLDRFRGTRPKMLEIGVQAGGSARLFAEWLGEGTRITGVDVDPACRANAVPGLIEIEIGDQADRSFLGGLAERHGPWNIILDDGGHSDNQILTSFEVLFPHLAEGGIYLIEDTHAHFFGGEFQDRKDNRSIVSFVAEQFSNLHAWTGDLKRFEYWHVPPPDRTSPVEVPYEARHVAAVHLFDSIIVIEKRERHEPFCERRAQGKARPTSFRLMGETEAERPTAMSFQLPAGDAPREVERLQKELIALKTSASWRLTAPLRRLEGLLKSWR